MRATPRPRGPAPRRSVLRAGLALGTAGMLGTLGACAPMAPAMHPTPADDADPPGEAPSPFTPADLATAAALRDAALADRSAARLLQALCHGIGARPAGSEADARAAAWAQQTLRDLGLSAVRAEALALNVWQRGPASAELLGAGGWPLTVAALGNSVATPAAGLEAEVALFPTLQALREDAGGRARGRIVVITQATARTRDGSGYGAAVGARFSGAVEAARRGAVAFGLRSVGTSGGDGLPVAHTGATSYDLSVPRIPAFALAVTDVLRLQALARGDAPLRMRLNLQARSGVPATTANVVAEIPGTDLAHEVVLISAHLDSWDVGQGAEDNGAGVAIVCAAAGVLARVLTGAGVRPRRTIRVVLFANEENGLDGARAYGERYRHVVHQWVGESDFGAGRIYRLAARVQPGARACVTAMAPVLAPLGVDFFPDRGAFEGHPSPDAALLMRRHRWPAVALYQDGTRYFDVHHTANDTLERLDPRYLQQNAACWAITAWLAAQAPVAFGPPSL